MLKKRIVGVLIVRNGIVVQSVRFRTYLPVGHPQTAVEYLNRWGIDEIVLLDISATSRGAGPDLGMVRLASAKCHVPLTVGGGIKSVADIHALMRCGADKVSLNSTALNHSSLVGEAAAVFGNQCVVVSVDAVLTPSGHRVYDHINRRPTDLVPAQMVKRMQDLGAGEILINSVDRDGTYRGYDIPLVESVCNVASVPVIACGGAKTGADMADLLQRTSVSAAAAANFFHFTEHSVILTKAIVGEKIPLRIETHATYRGAKLDPEMRVLKREDAVLDELLYQREEPEVI
jgi:cyclase